VVSVFMLNMYSIYCSDVTDLESYIFIDYSDCSKCV
jgi:hypothetical protein